MLREVETGFGCVVWWQLNIFFEIYWQISQTKLLHSMEEKVKR